MSIGGLGTAFARLGAGSKRGVHVEAPPDILPPNFTSPTSSSVNENSPLAHVLATDEFSTFTIFGGLDAAKFAINADTLYWSGAAFPGTTKDYESPDDSNADRIYNVIVRATDAASNTRDQTINITVLDVDDTPPNITSSAAVSNVENTTLLHTLTATDASAITWSKLGTGDSAHFILTGAVLSWIAPGTKDFEDPHGPAYTVTVRATDAAGNSTDQTLTVTVTNVAEDPPVNLVAPVLSGSETVGATLTVASNPATEWTNSPTLTYKWFRLDEAVAGDTLVDEGGEPLVDEDGEELVT